MDGAKRTWILCLLILAGLYLGWRQDPVEPAVTEEEKQQIFNAVEQYLRAAHLPPRDLPKRIISVEQIGNRRYKVHMEMQQGEGWFEVAWTGQGWDVKGLQPPRPATGLPSSSALPT